MANPNPSPATRFKPGNRGGGMTSETVRLNYASAELAAKIRNAMLSDVAEKLAAGADALELLSGDTLRLIKDSEDRAHGTPKQAVEVDATIRATISARPLTAKEWAAQHADDAE